MRGKKAFGSWFVTLMLTFSVVTGILTFSNHLRASNTTTSATASTPVTTVAPASAASTTPTTIVFHTGDDGGFVTSASGASDY